MGVVVKRKIAMGPRDADTIFCKQQSNSGPKEPPCSGDLRHRERKRVDTDHIIRNTTEPKRSHTTESIIPVEFQQLSQRMEETATFRHFCQQYQECCG